MPLELRERAFEALVAEYTSIVQLIDRKTNTMATLITFDVTAVATIMGFLFSGKADPQFLVLIPVVSSTLGLLLASQDHDTRAAETYVERTLRPLVSEYVGDDRLWRWNEHLVHGRNPIFVILTRAVPLGLLFPGIAIAALIAVAGRMHSEAGWLAWALAACLTILLLASWLDHGRFLLGRIWAGIRRYGSRVQP